MGRDCGVLRGEGLSFQFLVVEFQYEEEGMSADYADCADKSYEGKKRGGGGD